MESRMIDSVKVLSGYMAKLPDVGDKIFRFESGLNILFGPNGCGKSSLLKLLAGYTAAISGGWSKVHSSSFDIFSELPLP